MHRITLSFIIFMSFQFLACNNDDDTNNSGIPEGIELIDSSSENDCTLSACSEERVVRRIATDAEATMKKDEDQEFYISYHFGIDSSIEIYFCDLPSEFQQEGINIQYSGQLRDACGIKDPMIGGQSFYFLQISEIKLAD